MINIFRKFVKKENQTKTIEEVNTITESKNIALLSLINQDNFNFFMSELYTDLLKNVSELIYSDNENINNILAIKGKITQSYNTIMTLETVSNKIKNDNNTSNKKIELNDIMKYMYEAECESERKQYR